MAIEINRAIVVGSEGQDGRLLFDTLSERGCQVLGVGRHTARASTGDAQEKVDITSSSDVAAIISEWQPDATFYLPAIHRSSQEGQRETDLTLFERSFAVHVTGAINFLEALTSGNRNPAFFYAGSSLVFGSTSSRIQDEATPFEPNSIYSITKAAGIHSCRYYRAERGINASVGILYNHESPLRPDGFVSQRIVRAAVAIACGAQERLTVGNLQARIDWGYAPDFVDAMLRIVMCAEPDDYIVATGEPHTVEDFVGSAFRYVGLDWRNHVDEDPSLVQRADSVRIGDSTRLRARTGWHPTVTFDEMIGIMVEAAKASDAA